MVRPPAMNGQKPLNQTRFSVTTQVTRDAARPRKNGKFKNTLRFKETGLKTYPLFKFTKKKETVFSLI
jgi:hypothetical protein